MVDEQPLRAGANRVLLGRVRSDWVAHRVGPSNLRSADAIVDVPLSGASSPRATARPLADARRLPANVLVAGCAPALGVLLDRLGQDAPGRCHWIEANSARALQMLRDGLVHVAGVHLEDPQAGTDHEALVRARFEGQRMRLVQLLRWRLGLVHRRPEERVELSTLVEPTIRWVLREPGAGTRGVLERALEPLGVPLTSLGAVREAVSHHEVGRTVALGAADVGVAVEPVALELGLSFVPLTEEGFDLVVCEDIATTGPVKRLLEGFDQPSLRRELSALGPYDTAMMGHSTTP